MKYVVESMLYCLFSIFTKTLNPATVLKDIMSFPINSAVEQVISQQRFDLFLHTHSLDTEYLKLSSDIMV